MPPVYDTNTGISYLKDYYDPINKSYYRKSTFGGENVNTITKVVVIEDAVLYVPRESIELYRIAPLWENFTNIKAIEDME